jgi:hypothetical protein
MAPGDADPKQDISNHRWQKCKCGRLISGWLTGDAAMCNECRKKMKDALDPKDDKQYAATLKRVAELKKLSPEDLRKEILKKYIPPDPFAPGLLKGQYSRRTWRRETR